MNILQPQKSKVNNSNVPGISLELSQYKSKADSDKMDG